MRYIIKLVNALNGGVSFLASANRRNTPEGFAKCANCFHSFLVMRRTDRFCGKACQKQFYDGLRKFEQRHGRVEVAIDERKLPKPKVEKKRCLNSECKKAFYTKTNNQAFCSAACRTRYNLLIKYKDNKSWQRLDRIRKNGK